MANNRTQKLLSEFPPITTAQWEELIEADLKGADYQKKLVWRSAEGFNVRPYYRAEDLKNIKYLGAEAGEFPYTRGITKTNNWRIYQRVVVESVEQANQMAVRAIANGAEGVDFHLLRGDVSTADFEALVAGIDFTAIETTFSGKCVIEAARFMIDKAQSLNLEPKSIRVNFVIDPIMKMTLGEYSEAECKKEIEQIKSLLEKGAKYRRFRFVAVEGFNFHNSGSTIVQELAFTLAVGHEYVAKLMEMGVDANDASRSVRFSMGISSNYFMEIAKFRAGRMLWATVMEPYGATCGCASKMLTHAVTSKWNMTIYDPYVNMLRATTEAMSAAIAGVHSMSVIPFNAAYEHPTEFSSRIARNVQLLLKHESHLDNVTDASGGSYYIENLTQSIAEQAWELFKEVEKRGGYMEAFRSGFIQEQVGQSASKKDKDIATRRQVLLGTNQYPNFTEVAAKVDGDVCRTDRSNPKILQPYRGAAAFEEIRLRVDRSDREPKAFMLTAGTLAMARARAQFSSNFFGCAGIRVIDNNFFETIEAGVKKALASGAEIVVLCAADDDYAELAPKVKALLGDKAILVVAGAPASAPELEAQGIANFINVRSNVLESLKFYLKELGIK